MTKNKVTIIEAVDRLRRDAERENMSYETLMAATDHLKSAKDIRAYFEAYINITQEAVNADVTRGSDVIAVNQVKSGKPIREVATELAYDHLRHLINHYNDKRVHDRWNKALPELRTAGGLASIC